MKPYACYPGMRTRFQQEHSKVQHPFSHLNPFTPGQEMRPAANIFRKVGAYEIQLAVPGFAKEQIRLEVKEDQLVILATTINQEVQTPKFIRQEFDATSFKRTFRLHRNANSNALSATFDQGILTITIPDREPATIKINIQ